MSKIKTILVGDSQVGKTSIITQLVRQTFDEEYIQTIAGDKSTKDIDANGKTVSLEIWDTAGQEIYKNVNKIFMKNAKIAILVYDITSAESFKGLDDWYKQVCDVNDKETIKFGVIGNKSDLYEDQKVDKEEAEEYANKIKAVFGETSAMDYDSVFNYFTEICTAYNKMEEDNERKIREEEQKKQQKDKLDKIKDLPKEPSPKTIVLTQEEHKNVEEKKKSSGCC